MRVRVRVRVRVRGRVRVRVRSRFHRRISPPEPSARLPTAEHRGRRRPRAPVCRRGLMGETSACTSVV